MTTSTTIFILQVRGGKIGAQWRTYGLHEHESADEAQAGFAEAQKNHGCDEWQVVKHRTQYTSTVISSALKINNTLPVK